MKEAIIKKYTLTKELVRYFKDELKDFIKNPNKEYKLSKLLKAERLKNGKTLEDLASALGTSPLTIKEVEDSKLKVKFEELQMKL